MGVEPLGRRKQATGCAEQLALDVRVTLACLEVLELEKSKYVLSQVSLTRGWTHVQQRHCAIGTLTCKADWELAAGS